MTKETKKHLAFTMEAELYRGLVTTVHELVERWARIFEVQEKEIWPLWEKVFSEFSTTGTKLEARGYKKTVRGKNAVYNKKVRAHMLYPELDGLQEIGFERDQIHYPPAHAGYFEIEVMVSL